MSNADRTSAGTRRSDRSSTNELLRERQQLQARLRINRYLLHEHRVQQRFEPEPLKLVGFSFAAGFICHELGFTPGRIIRGLW